MRIALIGAPSDLGQTEPGVDQGPNAIRFPDAESNLLESLQALGHDVQDMGDLNIPHRARLPVSDAREKARYLRPIIQASKSLAEAVSAAAGDGRFPIVLGGDHSIAIGSVAGISSHYRKRDKKIGVIQVDAHPDMHIPETSKTHNVHGMWQACCIGWGPTELTDLQGFRVKVDPANVVVIGARSIDAFPEQDGDEKRNIERAGIRVYRMRDIDEIGIRKVVAEAIALASNGTDGIHVSFDMDFVDPLEAPGVGTRVPGGGSYRESHLIMEMLCESGRMASLDLVEVNPLRDDCNRTAKMANHLIESAMGGERNFYSG